MEGIIRIFFVIFFVADIKLRYPYTSLSADRLRKSQEEREQAMYTNIAKFQGHIMITGFIRNYRPLDEIVGSESR
jgi:hypothetical protein